MIVMLNLRIMEVYFVWCGEAGEGPVLRSSIQLTDRLCMGINLRISPREADYYCQAVQSRTIRIKILPALRTGQSVTL